MSHRLWLRTTEDTEALGAALARALPPGTPLRVVYLYGDLGAGKTTLVRGLLQQLGHAGAVRSPTYTLFETYQMGAVTVLHADLYRLRDPDELEALGLRDFAVPGYLWLVEWPQRGGELLPAADLRLDLTVTAAGHGVELHDLTPAGTQWLSKVEFGAPGS